MNASIDRAAWLAARNRGLGSSDVPRVLGLAPPSWGGPHRVWLEKRGLLASSEPTDCMRYGLHAERAILAYVAETLGINLVPLRDRVFRHPVEAWAVASPDAQNTRLVGETWHPVGVVETKNYGRDDGWGRDGDEADDETVPAHVLAQTMHQMYVTGWRDESYVAASLFGRAPRVLPIRWDDSYERDVVPFLRDWWHRHIIDGEPPPVDASDACARTLALVYPGDATRERVQRDDLAELAERCAASKEAAKAAESAAALAENELRAAMGNDDRILAGLVSATRVRNSGRTVLDMGEVARLVGPQWEEVERQASKQGAPYEYILVKRRKARGV